MANKEKKATNYIKKGAKILLIVVLSVIGLAVVLFLLILTPPVQKFATGKVESYLQKKLKTKVEIGSISFGLSGRIHLNNIYIEDQTKDTLLSGGSIKANVSLMKLFSNEVEVNDLALENITAKIKRILPDTVFNFQFITDAFVSEQIKSPDTAQTAPLKLSIYNLDLDNVNFVYKDVITGSDMFAHVGDLSAKIDSLDPYQAHFALRSLSVSNLVARIRQMKPLLVVSEPLAEDMAEAAQPITAKLNLGDIDLKNIDVQYANDVSALYSNIVIGKLHTKGKNIDLQNNIIHLNDLRLDNTTASIRMGKTEQAKLVKKEVKQEVEAQKQNLWTFRVDDISLNNNNIQFDDDNKPRLSNGMDYAHLDADSLTLQVKNFVMSPDSMCGLITKGYMKEKSGFRLIDLQGDVLYASNQTYLKDFYIKTPGTELKRNIHLTYNSFKALTDSFQKTQMDIDIPNSYVQVKDILVFAPQLRSQPAFRRPNEVWRLNLKASGNMDRMYVSALQFRGLGRTVIDAHGTLAGATNPNAAGGTFVIKRLHTTKSDIELLTGQSLSTPQMKLPETYDIRGTLSGNAKNLNTNLRLFTSAGDIALKGKFSNLTNPKTLKYNAVITTNGLALGSILNNPQIGSLSTTFNVSGQGFDPKNIKTNFKGNIHSFRYNGYTYRNVNITGDLKKTDFNAHVVIKDPNATLDLVATGNFAGTPSLKVKGMVDSLKTMPLNFTTQPLVFRGRIDADIPSLNMEDLRADVLITDALFVSGTDRLPLDSLHVVSGRNDAGQFLLVKSDIINAELVGQYNLADLGGIIQNNIQPYFSVTPYKEVKITKPYDFTFKADAIYSPVLSAFVPALKAMEPVHAEGRLATGQGMQASVLAPFISVSGNEINNLNLKVNTADSGLTVNGTIDRIKSSAMNVYKTYLNATARNNAIDFNLRMADKNNKDKYILGGLFTQPSTGNYTLSLRPDNLLLNYERWTAAPNNSIALQDSQIVANNFILQKNGQKLSIQSEGSGSNQPLNVGFSNFAIATITGFMQQDSLLVNGIINGNVSLRNLLTQPVFTSDLTVSDLSFKKDTIGNINAKVTSSGKSYLTDVTITGKGNEIKLTGSFAPQGKSDIALDLELAIRKFYLKNLEGMASAFLKSASGAISGNATIKGTSASPKINGSINFDSVSLNTHLLGGPFRIHDEQIKISENGFTLDNFSIRDTTNTALNINGNLQTTNFINYAFSLDVDAENFMAINSTKKDNKLYYGKMFLNTNLHIGGTEKAPIIDGSVRVNDATNFTVVLPQAEPGVADREGVVVFTDFNAPENDSLFAAVDSLNNAGFTGMDITTNIEIQKKANFNIVVDAANGDFLNIRGAGQLSAGIDPSGKITLTGTYEMEQGAYQLSFNFLQRKFTIEKGSKIVWLGEPTAAQVDVTAQYIANTAPLDLVENQLSDANTAQRNLYLQKLPFYVLLKMTGELMKPDITFDITLPKEGNYRNTTSTDIVNTVDTRLDQLRQEPSELNKQVFALLLLNRFVGENPFQSSGGGGGFDATSFARQSVSKLLTEQLNQLASGLVHGVDLTFDVASSDDYSTGEKRNRTDLNIGLSKRLLNDRLTITVGNNFELEGPQQSNQRSNNIAGNISANYQLSKDGRYMLRFYRKNEYQGIVDGYIIETGVGFAITVDYNRFSQLLHARRERAKAQAQAQKTVPQQNTANPQNK